ncbi:MAG: MiaB/RimO family radical SAM methylthiotransferase, partial [Chloroflexota bacterium]
MEIDPIKQAKPMTGSPHRPRVALETLGCKLNQAETERLARQLAGAGCELVAPDAGADIYLLNTCTVTGTADAKSRHLLRLARRRHPRARLIATGCYAQRAPGELAAIEGVGLVVGNADKPHLLRLLEANGWLDGPSAPADGAGRRNRAMVRVQDGCTRYCTYCIVPLVRGAEASLPPDEVLAEVKERLAEGAREVVLTGTEIGAYQHEGLDLKGLLERILAETGVVRLRLSSLQPGEITTGLLGLWDDGRLCRHFHLSLQSGSDGVLGRMQRSYTAGDYRRAVAFIGSRLSEVAVTTDVIVGFPGETAAEFEESFDFCRQTGFARIHVFP